ncbi:MAG: hypothetical protein M3Y87_29545 [Myxococcota bacterium]|nr:hypothetical protein [Myxococcota bacterium]
MFSVQRGICVLAVAGAMLGAVPGCATIATHEEYEAYRTLHQTRDENARLEALARYAQQYPGGLWIEEVRRERESNEQTVWAGNNATREGLQLYLTVYPDGTYVEQAQQRLAALGVVGERREVEEEHVEELHQEQREQAAEERRLWVTRAVQFWTRTLLGIQNYGQTIAQVARANPEFSQAFGQVPAPLCTPQACIKHYHGHYAIPVPGATRIERELHVFLRIRLDRGRVTRVEVLMPNKGFSRWYELANRTLITDEDPEQRQHAIEWALGQLEPVIAEVARGARPIDIVPEPIEPISQAAQAASAAPEDSDTEVPGDPQPPPPAAGTPPPAAEEGGIDQLLEQAVGADGQQQQALPEEPPPDMSALVLPIGLRAIQRGNVRMVVFAAGDEDYAEAYDGFYIELARD